MREFRFRRLHGRCNRRLPVLFFRGGSDQWVRKPGYPLLSLEHSYDAAAGEVVITVRQEQDEAWPTFRLPIAIEVSTEGGVTLSNVEMTDREQTFRVPASHAPTAVVMDPDGWVLKRLVGETLGG